MTEITEHTFSSASEGQNLSGVSSEYTFRRATPADTDRIMEIIEQAKRQMWREGKDQWTAAYPALSDIDADIQQGAAHVMLHAGHIVAYGAVVLTGEPVYEKIRGRWLTSRPYVVLHRLAVADEAKGHGVGVQFMHGVERVAAAAGVHSFRVDTNHDNSRMLRLLDKEGFTFCGNVYYRQGERMAYEKLL